MPRLSQLALADVPPPIPAGRQALMAFVFLFFFGVPFFAAHLTLLRLPYFWDEHGQFIPTALDLWRDGAWVAHSTLPNVHPPGVAMYLAAWFQAFGYSIPVVRIAMLVLACLGLVGVFLLGVELGKDLSKDLGNDSSSVPTLFLGPLLLMISPLFFMQGMMAQLDMPAMVLSVWALWFFLRGNHAAAAAISVALVLAKETGILLPAIFFAVLFYERKRVAAMGYVIAPIALGCWLMVLHHATGSWTGNADFAHYNISYSLEPVRVVTTVVRRIYYLFFAEFRWIATAALLFAVPRMALFRSRAWLVTGLFAAAHLALISLLGGAALERYVLPVLPLFYIAASLAFTTLPKRLNIAATPLLAMGLVLSLFWNPPYPFPFENNLAMVDFVSLQQAAAEYTETHFALSRIATAWPYTAGLARPDFGFVRHGLTVIETNDFHRSSIAAIPPDQFDVLITYTRTWAPKGGVVSIPLIRKFLTHFYGFEPEITRGQCTELGLSPVRSWSRHGQQIILYLRTGPPESRSARNVGEPRASGRSANL